MSEQCDNRIGERCKLNGEICPHLVYDGKCDHATCKLAGLPTFARMCAYHRSHECLMDDETYAAINHASELLRAYAALKDAVGRFFDLDEITLLPLGATAPVCMALGRVLTVETEEH